MSGRPLGRRLALLALAVLGWAWTAGGAWAQFCATCPTTSCPTGTCKERCQIFHCPPWLHHCQERPPVICIKCGCPRPVCNPCGLPNFGYYQTCWTPWPLPPDWAHCPVTPPAAYVQLAGPLAVPGTPTTTPPQRMRPPSGDMPPPTGPGTTQPMQPLPPLPPLELETTPIPRPLIPGPATPGKLVP